MILAFYYHYPVFSSNEKNYLPGFLGCFVDALAQQVEELLLVCHTITENKNNLYDYALQAKNITYLPIGPRTAAWHRHLFHKNILASAKTALAKADYLLVRSPTPLAPFFRKVIAQHKLVYLVVGDYEESVKQLPIRGLRDWVMKKYIARNDYLFKREMKRTHVLVNSPALYAKYKSIAKDIHNVRTTTLSEHDFFYREELFPHKEIKILYTGRIDLAKGLMELIEAFAQVHKAHAQHTFSLHLVGWEDQKDKPVEQALRAKAETLGVSPLVFFHGKKALGQELNAMYRMADIYIIPSYHEGFPRTIWEAMANGLAVIATTVGAIPSYLQHEQHALLIPPKQTEAITSAINTLLTDRVLAQHLVTKGYALAKENTLEKQTQQLIDIISTFQAVSN